MYIVAKAMTWNDAVCLACMLCIKVVGPCSRIYVQFDKRFKVSIKDLKLSVWSLSQEIVVLILNHRQMTHPCQLRPLSSEKGTEAKPRLRKPHRDHPFKMSAFSRGGGVINLPNLTTDRTKDCRQQGGRGQKSVKICQRLK